MAEPTWTPVAAAAAAARKRAIRPPSQLQIPRLADQIVPEAPVALLADEAKARFLVDAPRGPQHAVGPERDLPVAGLSCEAHALIHEPSADPEPARLGRHAHEAGLGQRG